MLPGAPSSVARPAWRESAAAAFSEERAESQQFTVQGRGARQCPSRLYRAPDSSPQRALPCLSGLSWLPKLGQRSQSSSKSKENILLLAGSGPAPGHKQEKVGSSHPSSLGLWQPDGCPAAVQGLMFLVPRPKVTTCPGSSSESLSPGGPECFLWSELLLF